MRFSDVIGHAVLKSTLVANAAEGRVSHAQLFLGPAGSGGLAMALAYAQYVVCSQPVGSDSCGVCPSCLKAMKLVHPDITFSFPVAPKEKISNPKSVDFIAEFREAVLANPYLSYHDWVEKLEIENKQGLINIHEARNIIQRLGLKSVEGSFRVVLMWLPEKMNVEAANCLLKILEEPEPKTLFLLVAENDESIPVTILSRTQLVKVNRLSDEEVRDGLLRLPETDPTMAAVIAKRVGGDFRLAKRLLEEENPDADYANTFLEWMRACLKLNISKIQELSDELGSAGRERQKAFMEFSLSVVRECLMMNYGDPSLVRMEGQEAENFRRFAPFIHQGNADKFISLLNDAHYHVERNANFKMLFMDLSFRIYHALNLKKEEVA